jgi:hypothetical protein
VIDVASIPVSVPSHPIHLGARFPPCMKLVAGVPIDTQLGCLNNTANPPTSLCTLEEICGFGGFKNGVPNQWFRLVAAIYSFRSYRLTVHIQIHYTRVPARGTCPYPPEYVRSVDVVRAGGRNSSTERCLRNLTTCNTGRARNGLRWIRYPLLLCRHLGVCDLFPRIESVHSRK